MSIAKVILYSVIALVLLLILKPTMTQQGSVMIFCNNPVNTRGATICLDQANRR